MPRHAKPESYRPNKALLCIINALEQTHATLKHTGALDNDDLLTTQGNIVLTLPVNPSTLLPKTIDKLQKALDRVYDTAFPEPQLHVGKALYLHRPQSGRPALPSRPNKPVITTKTLEAIREAHGLQITIPNNPQTLFEGLRNYLKSTGLNLEVPQQIIDWERIPYPADIPIAMLLDDIIKDQQHYLSTDIPQRVVIPLPQPNPMQTDAMHNILTALKNEAFAGRPEQLAIEATRTEIILSGASLIEKLSQLRDYIKSPDNRVSVALAIQLVDPAGRKASAIKDLFSDEIERGNPGRS